MLLVAVVLFLCVCVRARACVCVSVVSTTVGGCLNFKISVPVSYARCSKVNNILLI
jgi:hypothetical protein